MKIVTDAKRVLLGIYNLLDEDSYCLVVKINCKEFAEEYNMTIEHLNLCIHYLIEAGYIKGDFCFNCNDDATKEVTILPKAIQLEESTTF